jgi:TRAP transporter TAXI family solute receptor
MGNYFAYANSIAPILGEKMGIDVSVLSTAASMANIALLEEGRAEFAFVQNDVMTYAHNGTNLFSHLGPQNRFAAVAGLYDEVCHIVASEEIKEAAELKGRRVSIGEEGSGTALNAAQILETFGFAAGDIIESRYGFSDSARLFAAGEIDAFFCTAGAPVPAVRSLADSMRINIIPFGEARSRLLTSNYPYYTPAKILAGVYEGVNETNVIAVKAVLVARADIAEEDVYEVTKNIIENISTLNAESAVQGIPVPFHKGALRYYREQNVIK